MLVKDAEELNHLVTQYRAASTAKAQVQVLRQRAQVLSQVREKVRSVRQACELLKSHRLEFETVQPLADSVLHVVDKLTEASGSPEIWGGNEGKAQFNALSNRGIAALLQIEKRLLQTWQTHVDELTGKHDISVLAEWDHVAEFRQAARDIRFIQAKVVELRDSLPCEEEAFSRLKKLAQQLKEAWGQLDKTPSKVLKFLRQASTVGGAPLSLLDDDVRDWIRQRKIEESFKVRTVTANPHAD